MKKFKAKYGQRDADWGNLYLFASENIEAENIVEATKIARQHGADIQQPLDSIREVEIV
jgi:hypothetical protein